MWERWNATSKIFEKSFDNGQSWSPLGLNASIITEGTFDPARLPTGAGGRLVGTGLDISGGNNENYFSGYSHIRLHLRETSQAAGNQTFTIMNHQAQLIFSATPDDEGMVWSPAAMSLTRAGALSVRSNISVGGSVHNTGGYIYPGNVIASGGYQGQWFLGSHTSYGLYSNTGLYLESYVWTIAVESRAHIRAAGGLYDYARSTPICHSIDQWLPSYLNAPGLSLEAHSMSYALCGKMMFISVSFSGTQSGDQGIYYLTLPEGATHKNTGHMPTSCFMTQTGWSEGLATFTQNQGWLNLYAPATQPFYNGSSINYKIQMFVFIN